MTRKAFAELPDLPAFQSICGASEQQHVNSASDGRSNGHTSSPASVPFKEQLREVDGRAGSAPRGSGDLVVLAMM
jgi:hypothetical protein